MMTGGTNKAEKCPLKPKANDEENQGRSEAEERVILFSNQGQK
jgi:hypothetical protein